MIYGYSAIPNAGTAVNRLLTSPGEKTRHAPTNYFFMGDEINYRLGHPGVCTQLRLVSCFPFSISRKYVIEGMCISSTCIYLSAPGYSCCLVQKYITQFSCFTPYQRHTNSKSIHWFVFTFIASNRGMVVLEIKPATSECAGWRVVYWTTDPFLQLKYIS